MYCRKCGRYIPNEDEYCENCIIEASLMPAYPRRKEASEPLMPSLDLSSDWRGMSILSVILSNLSLFLPRLSFSIRIIERGLDARGGIPLLAVFFLTAAAGIALGAIGISRFRRARRLNANKPIATLVLGIVGVVVGAISMIEIIASIALMIVAR